MATHLLCQRRGPCKLLRRPVDPALRRSQRARPAREVQFAAGGHGTRYSSGRPQCADFHVGALKMGAKRKTNCQDRPAAVWRACTSPQFGILRMRRFQIVDACLICRKTQHHRIPVWGCLWRHHLVLLLSRRDTSLPAIVSFHFIRCQRPPTFYHD